MGKQEAHRVVEEASRRAATSKRDLQDVLHEDQRVTLHLSVGELAKLFEPLAYQGAAQVFIDRIAASLHGRSGKR
jgi:3-carboxy-cis,cis-muconate cycloisomerase